MEDIFRSPSELTEYISTLSKTEFLLQDFLPRNSIAIMVGDSNLGKTPFCIQLAAAVASGAPFLGHATFPAPIVYADYENSSTAFRQKLDDICHGLSLPIPENIYHCEGPSLESIKKAIALHSAKLLIIDTLRLFDPRGEQVDYAPRLMQTFRQIAKAGCTVLFLHHPRKDSDDPVTRRRPLGHHSTRLMDWIQCSSGSLALINQSDIRMGFDHSHADKNYEAVVRVCRRGLDELSPLRLARDYDDASGLPICYRRVKTETTLTPAQMMWLAALPPTPLKFKDIQDSTRANPKLVTEFLKTATALALILKTGQHRETRYLKV